MCGCRISAGIGAVAEALVARAMLRAGAGQVDPAWADLLAAHRIGRALGQDPTLIGRMVGFACCNLAATATNQLAASGRLSATQAQTMLADMQKLPPAPQAASAMDQAERYMGLDTACQVATTLGGLPKFVADAGAGSGADARSSRSWKLKLAGPLDWNQALHVVNARYDDMVQAMTRPTFTERLQAIKQQTQAMQAASDSLGAMLDSGQPMTSKEVGDFFVMELSPLGRAQVLADLCTVRQDLAVVAVALAACKAQQGEYPATLDALSPVILKAVPRDICSDKAFVYKRTARATCSTASVRT